MAQSHHSQGGARAPVTIEPGRWDATLNALLAELYKSERPFPITGISTGTQRNSPARR